MNPKELAERLSNAYRAVTELGYESELSTLDVLDAMRQAADLLATLKEQWVADDGGYIGDAEEPDPAGAEMMAGIMRERGAAPVVKRRYVTPWVAEEGAGNES